MPDAPKTLLDTVRALTDAASNYDAAVRALASTNDYGTAMIAWKEGHKLVLALKDTHNSVYKHLSELKPKTPKADKLKPGGEIDNPPTNTNAKKDKGKKERRAEAVTEANSDEP